MNNPDQDTIIRAVEDARRALDRIKRRKVIRLVE
jgi:hypothetical protein